MKAINSKVEQEQLRLAAENKLLTVEAEQKQKVAIAEAEANAVKAKADGDAYATVKNATANAEALRVQASAITSSPQILELKRIEVEMTKAGRTAERCLCRRTHSVLQCRRRSLGRADAGTEPRRALVAEK
jgi:prohibitin 2